MGQKSRKIREVCQGVSMIIIVIIIKVIMATRILILALRKGFVTLGKSFSLSLSSPVKQ